MAICNPTITSILITILQLADIYNQINQLVQYFPSLICIGPYLEFYSSSPFKFLPSFCRVDYYHDRYRPCRRRYLRNKYQQMNFTGNDVFCAFVQNV